MISATPFVAEAIAHNAAFATIGIFAICFSLPLLALKGRMPEGEGVDSADGASGADRDLLVTILVVCASFLVLTANGAVWSFSFVIGGKIGLDAIQLNHAAVIANAMGIIGCFAVIWLTRFGKRFWLIAFSLAVVAFAGCYMCIGRDGLLFRLGMVIDITALNLLFPAILGLAADLDMGGRVANIVGLTALLAQASGPLAGGFAMQQFGQDSMAIIAAVSITLGLGLFAVAFRTIETNRLIRSESMC